MIIDLLASPQLCDAVVKALVSRLGGDVILSAGELNGHFRAHASTEDAESLRIIAIPLGDVQ